MLFAQQQNAVPFLHQGHATPVCLMIHHSMYYL